MVKIKFSEEFTDQPAVLRVIGVGGGGGNAVNRMIQSEIKNVEFIAANTDAQWLRHSSLAPMRLQLGSKLTKGLGVGGDPEKGNAAALESEEDLRNVLTGADMVFITAGMGGGTGTGAAPIVAKLARELGILTVGVVTRPFEFEGRARAHQAESGIGNMRQFTDTLVVIPNDRLFSVVEQNTPWEDCFRIVDDVLRKAVQAISDVITRPQEVNMDFANVRALMANAGVALMGIGEASGKDRAIRAAQQAIDSPLLENVSINGAKGLLVNISGKRRTVTMHEVRDAMNFIYSAVSPDARVFGGLGSEDTLDDSIRITVIATGIPAQKTINSFRDRRVVEHKKLQEPPQDDQENELEHKNFNHGIDLESLKKPAFLRRRPRLIGD
ncbi:MAG: cell division protein FtsZ [Elusimicrobia bacterium RIFCSPLOWO2_02_FULL_39_32]|nr:MAG: cell division protein FtsZ [Elusimicrobia bacterium GWA2_38_7]OGR81123.1 MAG: cell division protein FtsZ [Elusimicrobia bacterium RIFCSPHIGHO2_02_FULL_39_36]OGR91011.1 MAG: cell division protein FtsZ [Elusimicrobia bacterium RIFCSPLOWO2_02_FULL_39_32]OGR98319.1 MAG: cell division protein FtsZ [Elusimicrobia bacterium RIFCSPLOWO2_12_FULL_39_28]